MNYHNFVISGWARRAGAELAALNRNAFRAEAEHRRLWGGFLCGFIVGGLFIFSLIGDSWLLFGVNILLGVLWTWNYWVTVGNEMSRISVEKIIEWAEHVKNEIEKDSERLKVENNRFKNILGGSNGKSIH